MSGKELMEDRALGIEDRDIPGSPMKQGLVSVVSDTIWDAVGGFSKQREVTSS